VQPSDRRLGRLDELPVTALSAILSFRITDAANLAVASHSIWPLSMVGTSVQGLVLTPVDISRAVLSSTNRTHSNRTWRASYPIPEPQDGHPSLVSCPYFFRYERKHQ